MDATLTLKIPSSLQQAIDQAARSQGTTVESLAAEVLRERFTPADDQPVVEDGGGTLADQLAYYIGAIDSAEYVPNDARPSGSQYGKSLLKRHREGYP
jgi:hypothetical protein